MKDTTQADAIKKSESFWLNRYPAFFNELAKLIEYRSSYGFEDATFYFDKVYRHPGSSKRTLAYRNKAEQDYYQLQILHFTKFLTKFMARRGFKLTYQTTHAYASQWQPKITLLSSRENNKSTKIVIEWGALKVREISINPITTISTRNLKIIGFTFKRIEQRNILFSRHSPQIWMSKTSQTKMQSK